MGVKTGGLPGAMPSAAAAADSVVSGRVRSLPARATTRCGPVDPLVPPSGVRGVANPRRDDARARSAARSCTGPRRGRARPPSATRAGSGRACRDPGSAQASGSAVDELGQQRGELERVGRPGCCGRRRRRPRRAPSAAAEELGDVVVVDDGESAPRTSSSGTVIAPTTSQSAPKSAGSPSVGLGERGTAVAPAPSCRRRAATALCRMPRRSDDSERVGLNSTVRARISSKSANDSGPFTNAAIAEAFSRFTPGVTSTSTSAPHELGRRAASAIAVRPPSDMPTTARGVGRERADGDRDVGRRCSATAETSPRRRRRSGRGPAGRSRRAGGRAPARRCPTCGRSGRRRAAARARARPSPQTSALEPPLGVDVDRTRGARSADRRRASPNSSAFSWNSPNSS